MRLPSLPEKIGAQNGQFVVVLGVADADTQVSGSTLLRLYTTATPPPPFATTGVQVPEDIR